MSFSEWLARGWSKDARFKAIEKNRERESMFEEYVTQLRSKEQQTTKSKLGNVRDQFYKNIFVREKKDDRKNAFEHKISVRLGKRYRKKFRVAKNT